MLLLCSRIKAVFIIIIKLSKRTKYERPFSMDYRERGYHARGVSHTGYLAHENNKGEARGRSRHKNHSKIVQNMEARNVRTIKGKSPKQGLTSPPYHAIIC